MSYLQELKTMIDEAPKKEVGYFDIQKYMGTKDPFLGLQNKTKYTIARVFQKKHPDLSFDKLIGLLNELNLGNSFEEKTIGPGILDRYKKYFPLLRPTHFDTWLSHLEGWCEIDSLCQSSFIVHENWSLWEKPLRDFAKSPEIAKRRASLVLLCKLLTSSDNIRIFDLAIENVETLKHEKDILITKAVSWVLREMVKNFKGELRKYLDLNEDSLPAIARREARKKLETGKKT